MKIQGQTIILEAGEEITIKAQVEEEPIEPVEPEVQEDILNFNQLLS